MIVFANLSDEDRALLMKLEAIRNNVEPTVGKSTPGHTYPAGYQPEGGEFSREFTAEAWAILDCLKPGAISDVARIFLCGLITGSMDRLVKQARAEGWKHVVRKR